MTNIIFLGDIHGEFKTLINLIKRYDITDSTIIQVGDFGVGFYSPVKDRDDMLSLNICLRQRNCTMYAIRGNHDDPKFFKGDTSFSNLLLVPDYTKISVDGINILLVGGALSLDRFDRIQMMKPKHKYDKPKTCYWKDELFVLNETKLRKFTGIDVVVTHTTPTWCFPEYPSVVNPFLEKQIEKDPKIKEDLEFERTQMDRFFEILSEKNTITHHYYGHFHDTHTKEVNGCKHILLNINEFKDLRL